MLLIVRAVHTSPHRRGLSGGLPELLAQMSLVGEAAPQCNLAQGRLGRKHVLSSQFHATTNQENVRRLPEGAFEGAGEVCFAALNKHAQIRDQNRPCDMTINIVTHLTRLPGQQPSPSIGNLSLGGRINLPPQQRGCFQQCILGRVHLVVKLPHSCLEQRNYPVHPLERLRRTWIRNRRRLFKVTIHYQSDPPLPALPPSDRVAAIGNCRHLRCPSSYPVLLYRGRHPL